MRVVGVGCVLAWCAVSVSCGGSEADPLLVGTWRQTAIEHRVGAGPWAPADDPCRLDNVEEFESDGSWTLYDGVFDCGGNGTTIARGEWRLEASNTKLIFNYDGALGDYENTVELLDETTLVVSHATGLTSGLQVKNTYRRQ